jgi:hypothetical protein
MATLTEKEITIQAAGVQIDLWAEYLNGELWEITATIDLDGHRIKDIRIYDGLKFTSFYGALLLAFHPAVVYQLEYEVAELVKLNEN